LLRNTVLAEQTHRCKFKHEVQVCSHEKAKEALYLGKRGTLPAPCAALWFTLIFAFYDMKSALERANN
jgi:hypothetical protein